MTAQDRHDAAAKAGYTVWASQWQGSGGDVGVSWVITDPAGNNLDDYEGSEKAGWSAAYRHMRAAAAAERKLAA